jgi:hypothetical protein
MRLRVQRGNVFNGDVAEADDITYVVLYSDEGDPILVAEQVGQNHIQVTRANETTFTDILRRLGVIARATT